MQFFDSRPELLGISPHTIERFLDRCEAGIDSLYSFTIVKGDRIAAKGYYRPMEPGQLKMTHSLSKSMNSLAVGIALGDGKLRLNDRLIDFFPEELPKEHDPRIERITIKDMLRMAASSVATSAAFSRAQGSWRRFYLESIPEAEPGSSFSYDTGAAYMLSCIVTKVMGKNSLEVLKERVFGPMGIDTAFWLEDGDGNSTGGWGFYVKAEDMVKLGRLVLNFGKWDGVQLIPEWYMREATAKQIDTYANPGTGWAYGYGYQFWRYPENTFGWFGAFGQLLVCSEEKDLYVVTTGGCTREENRRLLTMITETIFAEASDGVIPMEDEAYEKLKNRIGSLTLPAASGEKSSRKEELFFGKDYVPSGESDTGISKIRISRENGDSIRIRLIIKEKTVSFEAGYRNWMTTEDGSLDSDLHSLHSWTYGWKEEGRLLVKQYMCNTMYYRMWDFRFIEDKLKLTITQNIAIGGKCDWEFEGNVQQEELL